MYYDLAQTSLVKTPISLAEMYIPLWVYSSGSATSTATTAGSATSFLQKGSTTLGASTTTASKLHNLNSSWQSTQNFAFEASISNANASYTTYVALWDITAGTIVSSSQLSTTSTTKTLLRSSSFTLIPGHVYGITLWTSNASYAASLTKAHLIALLS